MVKKGLLLLLFMAVSILNNAQDIHFTQYFFSPLNLNPAYTGAFDGDYRIVGNHRSQWGAVISDQYLTSGLSYDQNINLYNHQLAAGINYVHDQSSIGVLAQNKLELNAAYRKKLKGHLLGAGLQLGMIHKGIDFNKYTYPNQFNMDDGYFDNTNFSNQQNFSKNNIYLFDFSFGLFWQKALTEKLIPTVGLTFMHLNTPNESFLENEENKLPLRKVLDISATYLFSSKIKLIPKILFMHHANAQELVWGGLARYRVAPNKYKLFDVFAGFSSRNGFKRNYDSFTMLVGGTVREFQLGLSYDINTSELSTISHYRGAFELSLIYIAKNTKAKIVNVPCDRL